MAFPDLEEVFGRAVSWAELKGTINVGGGISMPTIDIKAINHEAKVERGEQRGAGGGNVKKRTTGQGSQSGSATFYRSGMRALKRELKNAAVKANYRNSDGAYQLSKVTWDWVITLSWDDDPLGIYIFKLIDCHLDSDTSKHEEGNEAETVEANINPRRVVEVIDGVDTVLL